MRDAVEWRFATPILQFVSHYTSFAGSRIQGIVTFNQPIQHEKVFRSLTVIAGEGEICDCRLLSLEERGEEIHHEIMKRMEKEKNFLAFEIEDDLNQLGVVAEKGKEVEVAILPGALSKDGPLPLEKRLSYKFRVWVKPLGFPKLNCLFIYFILYRP
jgi:hypothetical protein